MSGQPSIKKNFAYKSALTLSNYLMAFITFPYVSRVLGVERIGLVNFVDNTVGYFLLFATMGVNLLGVREIASVKNNFEERSKVFSNILGLNLMFTGLTLLIYFLVVSTVPKLQIYSELFFIGSAKIISTAFIAEWFFTGIEDFRYITIRSLAIKVLYVISVFVFVRSRSDYKLYFILTIITFVLNAIVNMLYIRRYVRMELKSMMNRKYLKQNCILGVYSIMSSMYLTFNVMFLGLVSDNVQVGYYTTAYKVYMVVLGLFSAFTNVMMPRMSSLLSEGEDIRFRELADKSFRAMCTFSIPMIVFTMILSPQIIYILSGSGYEGAITPMRIIMPAALFVGIAQVLAIQILTPMKRDKILFTASIIGASISLAINISAVRYLASIGSAMVLLCSEIAVTTTYIVYVKRRKVVDIPFDSIWKNIIVSIPSVVLLSVLSARLTNPYYILLLLLPGIMMWLLMRRIVCGSIKKYI